MRRLKENQYEDANEFTDYKNADSGTANVDSKLINPFRGMRPEQMENLIESFMEKTKIEDILIRLDTQRCISSAGQGGLHASSER